jgi:tetratricopeptide (TPR) repeat protein
VPPDVDIEQYLSALVHAIATFVELNDEIFLLEEGASSAVALVAGAAEDERRDDLAAVRTVVVMFHACRQEVLVEEGEPPEMEWRLLLLAAVTDDEVPAGLRSSLAYGVVRAISFEGEVRAAARALGRAIFQDDVSVLDACIERLLATVDDATLPPRLVGRCQNRLASGYWQRFESTRDPSDLDRALAHNEKALTDANGRELAEAEALRASLFLERFRVTGKAEDLHIVEKLCGDAADGDAPLDNLTRELVVVLRNARLDQFESTGEPVWLDEVIRLGERAVRTSRDAESPVLLAAHATAYAARYELADKESDLDKSIEYYRYASEEASDPAMWLGIAGKLWAQLSLRLRTTPGTPDKDELIALNTKLISALDGELRTDVERRQARLLWDRFGETLSPEDLDSAVDVTRALAERLGESEDLSNLCYLLLLRHKRTAELSDIDDAVVYGRSAVQRPHEDPEQLALHLSNLFGALGIRADISRAAGALDKTRAFVDEAMRVAERVMDLFPPHDPRGVRHRNNLVVALWGRFQTDGDPGDLDLAIEHAQRGLAGLAPKDAVSSVLGPSLLAALTLKLDHSRDDATLDQVIALVNRGIGPNPSWLDGLRTLISVLDRLTGLEQPAEDTGLLSKLRQVRSELLPLYQQGVVVTSMEIAGAGATIRNLDLVNTALDGLDHAMSLADEKQRAVLMGARGEVLIRRWQLTLARADLDDGIDSLIISADRDGPASVMAAYHRKSAATALMRRFRRRRRAGDLDEAERQLQAAEHVLVESDPEAHDELTRTIASIRSHRDDPPFSIIHMDVLEADREGLSSPHGLANLDAWNRGAPRTSGLTWVHTTDVDDPQQPSRFTS